MEDATFQKKSIDTIYKIKEGQATEIEAGLLASIQTVEPAVLNYMCPSGRDGRHWQRVQYCQKLAIPWGS